MPNRSLCNCHHETSQRRDRRAEIIENTKIVMRLTSSSLILAIFFFAFYLKIAIISCNIILLGVLDILKLLILVVY